jgi:hypothetical protein
MRSSAALPLSAPEPWQGITEWIGHYHGLADGRRYMASLTGAVAGDASTLSVAVDSPDGPIATCKCSLIRIDHGPRSLVIFAPLVVIWAEGRGRGGCDLGKSIIAHLVSAFASFRDHRSAAQDDVLVASGNLTKAKGGRPFFESLGWQIIDPRVSDAAGDEAMAEAFSTIVRHIDAAVAPLRAAGRIEDEPVTFALLRLR